MFINRSNTPPVYKVSELEFHRSSLISVAERAVKRHGFVVTMQLPTDQIFTILARSSHVDFWEQNGASFRKDTADPKSGVSLSRLVLGRALLTEPEGRGWEQLRQDTVRLLGEAKAAFRLPLPLATADFVAKLHAYPERTLAVACLDWATQTMCEPVVGNGDLNEDIQQLVNQLNIDFRSLVANPDSAYDDPQVRKTSQLFNDIMARVSLKHGPDTVAAKVLARGNADDDLEKNVEHLRSQVGGLLAASLQINAFSLLWVLVHLSSNPALQDEIAAEAMSFGHPPRRAVDTPLAFATVREAQRLTPQTAFVARQTTRDIEIDGFVLPEGHNVMFSPWLVQRSEESWADALQFNPGRFMNGDRIQTSRYFPFGIGQRGCPAANIINQQLTYAVSHICRSVSFSLDAQTRVGDLAPVLKVNVEPRGPVRLNTRYRCA